MSAYPDLPSYNIHSAAPSVESEDKVPSEPEAPEQEPLAQSRREKLKNRCLWFFNRIAASARNTRYRFRKLDETISVPPAENPETFVLPKLAQLVETKQRPQVLLQNGFSSASMLENNIELQDLRRVGYTAKELFDLFGSWEALKEAGFTKHNMDSELWSLDLIASLFQSSSNYGAFVGTNALQLAHEMNFTLDDYLRTLPNVSALASLLNAEALLRHDIAFRHIFKMHLTPECFRNDFGATRDNFLELQNRVTPVQLQALTRACNWNMYNLDRVFGIKTHVTPLKLATH
jgi:hypothetical protein